MGLSTQHHTSRFLTHDEVQALPDGTAVRITWSGGNGPWTYRIKRHRNTAYVVLSNGKHLQSITFVGAERFHTRVSLVDSPTSTRDTCHDKR